MTWLELLTRKMQLTVNPTADVRVWVGDRSYPIIGLRLEDNGRTLHLITEGEA